MDKKFGYYVFGGLLTGAWFGSIWVAGSGLLAIGIGALAGAFIGWFLAAAVHEQQSKKK